MRVAVAGAGYFARFHLEAWQRLAAEGAVELVALAEPDRARREDALAGFAIPQGFDDAERMLDAVRPDLFDIVTPPASHASLIAMAAKRRIDCISQKPLAPSFDEAVRMVEVAESAGIRLVVHENFRWMPWYAQMQRYIEDGTLGAPHSITVRMRPGDGQGSRAYLDRQPYFQSMPRFLVHETAIHFIDTFRYLLGEVLHVTARLRRLNPVIAGEDAGTILLEFASGATALIDANRLNDHVADNTRLTMGEHWLEGTGGVLRLSGDGALFWKPHRGPEIPHAYEWNNRGHGGDCVYRQQRHIVAALAVGNAPVNAARDYLRNLEIEEAVYRSSAEGRTVTLEPSTARIE
ncbi:MAG: Gfo/Idh/MocA family protein [Burkholderiales bacterium]